jgi:hypothetical protein
MCTALIAREAGVVVTAPMGGLVRASLDTESNVAWVGYANSQLQAQIESVLQRLLIKHGLIASVSSS